jgi:hypothetical protein
MEETMGPIDWTTILSYVGFAYLVLTAAAAFFSALAVGFEKFWPGGAQFFAAAAQICGTIAGALHTIPTKLAAKKAAPLATMALLLFVVAAPGCLAGSFEEARIVGVAANTMKRDVAAGKTPTDAKANAAVAVFQATPSEYCASLDSQQMVLHGFAAGAGALGASSGIPALVLPTSDDRTRMAFMGTALAFSATAAVLVILADGKSTAWVRDCAQGEASK